MFIGGGERLDGFELAYEAFEEEILYGATLSRQEVTAVRALISGEPNPLSGRVLREFRAKLGLSDSDESATV